MQWTVDAGSVISDGTSRFHGLCLAMRSALHEREPSAAEPVANNFQSPIRPDIVQSVHTGMNKNKRQPYAVSEKAGHQTSAESWGTGRAVARIPRVSGGGTHRAGQAAFGNMCRSGRMFAVRTPMKATMSQADTQIAHQGLAQVAPEDQPQPEALRDRLRARRLWQPCSSPRPWPRHLHRPRGSPRRLLDRLR